tara:strand:- start:143 stop:283 length:141 start_codon:yes stop_codon:yes gene_type:complete
MSIYLGSKIFNGTEVLGNIIKLLNGNTGIILGKFFIFFNKLNIIDL